MVQKYLSYSFTGTVSKNFIFTGKFKSKINGREKGENFIGGKTSSILENYRCPEMSLQSIKYRSQKPCSTNNIREGYSILNIFHEDHLSTVCKSCAIHKMTENSIVYTKRSLNGKVHTFYLLIFFQMDQKNSNINLFIF